MTGLIITITVIIDSVSFENNKSCVIQITQRLQIVYHFKTP